MRILVVDDYSTMRRILKDHLIRLGYSRIEEAADGREALQKIGMMKFDLVLCEWNTQPVSGLELLRAMRADKTMQHVPFIMITTGGHPDNIRQANQAGVSGYVIKPFSTDILKARIDHVLGKCD